MITSCLAIAAYLCINQPAKVDLFKSTIITGISVDVSGVNIESISSSDGMAMANIEAMKKVCGKDGCFYYNRYCEESEKNFKCEIAFAFKQYGALRTIKISGPKAKVIDFDYQVYFSPFPGTQLRFQDLSFDNGKNGFVACLPRRGCKGP